MFLYRWVYKEWLKTFNVSSQQRGTWVLLIIATWTKDKKFVVAWIESTFFSSFVRFHEVNLIFARRIEKKKQE